MFEWMDEGRSSASLRANKASPIHIADNPKSSTTILFKPFAFSSKSNQSSQGQDNNNKEACIKIPTLDSAQTCSIIGRYQRTQIQTGPLQGNMNVVEFQVGYNVELMNEDVSSECLLMKKKGVSLPGVTLDLLTLKEKEKTYGTGATVPKRHTKRESTRGVLV
eukprot:15358936-Ditylum_brightwellii.AAC.1